ncbi:NADPH-dependent FMN reductase [Corallococcus macrosporus]|uniref:NADPH-dependent FMN reductase n=1 Tax=Myxococcus fulvus (strain ATCC BAA-855 / HW-1) TaxID=483219 RepID=F8CCZ5_MYXFH|nr:NAD(P)H-dependent oxidoreductase [Corallococcus macrosporus]AEI64711.1 NADPH-dependent FMN reductase [Corallococcus macrosporus]
MTTPRILAISGSLRTGSFNRKLLDLAVAHARSLGADVDVVDLKALALPVYDGDVEAKALPAPVEELRERLGKAQGLLIASPEYNSSIPGGLKNAIDWVSRPPGRLFQDKWVAMMGATPGGFGTARMQPHLRQVMSSVGSHVLPTQVHMARAGDAFSPDGKLKDEARQKEVEALAAALVSKLKP